MDQKLENITEPEEKTQTSEQQISSAIIENATKQLEELQSSLLDKAAEIENLHEVALEQEKRFEAEVSSLKSQLEELKASLEAANTERDSAVSELKKIQDDALLNERLSALKDLGILRSSEEAQIKQAERIKLMSEEEFEDYKAELTDIKGLEKSKEGEKKEETVNEAADLIESAIEEETSEDAKERIRQMLGTLTDAEVTEEATEAVQEEPKKESASIQIPSVEALIDGFSKLMKL